MQDMTIHQNLIAGEWVGSDAIENINPSNTGVSPAGMPAHLA